MAAHRRAKFEAKKRKAKKKAAGPVWTTREGKKIAVSKMGFEHLMNAYAMMARQSRNANVWCVILFRELKLRAKFEESFVAPIDSEDMERLDLDAPF